MGADLYIRKLQEPVKAEWQPKFDEAVALRNAAQDDVAKAAAQKLVDEAYEHLWGGDHYFRDSYNSTSVLWRLGLSWWRDLDPRCSGRGCGHQLFAESLPLVSRKGAVGAIHAPDAGRVDRQSREGRRRREQRRSVAQILHREAGPSGRVPEACRRKRRHVRELLIVTSGQPKAIGIRRNRAEGRECGLAGHWE